MPARKAWQTNTIGPSLTRSHSPKLEEAQPIRPVPAPQRSFTLGAVAHFIKHPIALSLATPAPGAGIDRKPRRDRRRLLPRVEPVRVTSENARK